MSGRLQGKTALVTGAGSGIGRATALRFAAEGARVVVTDLQSASAEEVAACIVRDGGTALARGLDVTDEAAWTAVLGETAGAFGPLDVLVANAGISFARPVVDMSLAEWRRVLAVNLDGVFLALHHGLPRMADGGSVVIVSSASGIKAAPGASAYAASKGALRSFAKSVALECVPRRIRVNTVLPGAVETALWESMPFFQDLVREHGDLRGAYAALAAATPHALPRFARAEEIAAAILHLASDEAGFTTGAELVIDGGYSA